MQTKDLLTARIVGSEQYIITFNLTSCRNPVLLRVYPSRSTAADTATKSKKRLTVKEREQKRIEKCLRRRLSWCNKEGNSYEGNPQKECKAKWTTKLLNRYPQLSSFSCPTTHEAVIIDFIFMLYTTPTKGHTIMNINYYWNNKGRP